MYFSEVLWPGYLTNLLTKLSRLYAMNYIKTVSSTGSTIMPYEAAQCAKFGDSLIIYLYEKVVLDANLVTKLFSDNGLAKSTSTNNLTNKLEPCAIVKESIFKGNPTHATTLNKFCGVGIR